jgi:sulfite exporter TauE/SafE
MKSTKTMFFGIILMLLGVGLIQPGNDHYLAQTLPFLGGDIMTTIFPIVSLALIVLGVIVGIVGVFLRK